MKKAYVAILVVLLLVPISVLSGNSGSVISHKVRVSIPRVALINIVQNADNDANKSFHRPKFQNGESDKHWINYSSIVSHENSTRSVMVAISGELPEGIVISVKATTYRGNGNGKTGVPVEKVRLSEIPQPLITDIGSCYTGTGTNNGHMISYEIDSTPRENDKNLKDFSHDICIVYTLTD